MRLARWIANLAALCVVVSLSFAPATPAAADVCNPAFSTAPSHINLVGTSGGVADPHGLFQVTLRDRWLNLIRNSLVCVDLSACPDLRVAATQPYPGLYVDCPRRTVCALTNIMGVARFVIVGSGRLPRGTDPNCPKAIISGEFCGAFPPVSVGMFDLDGAGGVGSNDLSYWLTDFLSSQAFVRSDFDGSGTLSANDLSLWIGDFLAAGSIVSAGAQPGGLCP